MSQHPGYTLCICPDSYLLKVRIKTLLAARATSDGSPWEQHIFWGDDPIPSSFWDHMTLQGLFAHFKALVIRNAQNVPAEALREISETIIKSSGSVWPILCFEVPIERDKVKLPAHILKLPCYTLAETKKWIDITPGLDAKNFPVFIREECHKLEITLLPGQDIELAQRLPLDAQRASAELQKLSFLRDHDGKISKASIAYIEKETSFEIFSLLQLIQKHDHKAVWEQVFEGHTQQDSNIFGFLAILLREGRVLWQILHGESPALPPYLLSAKKILAQSLGRAKIARIWDMALRAEKGIKTGEKSPEQAMDALIAELFLLFS